MISHPDKSYEVEIAKVILTYKEMFLVRSGVKGDTFSCVVNHIDTKGDASDYKYEFTCENNEHSQIITVSNAVQSITSDINEIIESGKCVLIPKAVIKNYIQQVFVIHFRYYIKISPVK